MDYTVELSITVRTESGRGQSAVMMELAYHSPVYMLHDKKISLPSLALITGSDRINVNVGSYIYSHPIVI